jgi:TRAP-type C4-dicarboxylate transport system permease small subunit
MSVPPSVWEKMVSFLNRLEEILLGSILIFMVLLGALQVLFRNVLSISLFWIDPVMRHMVLWIALLGASVATREDRHISIDLFSGRLNPLSRAVVKTGIHLFSAAICLFLVLPALHFVREEYAVGKILALGIPNWASQMIMPVMLFVLAIRFLGKAWAAFNQGIKCSSLHLTGNQET